jgi:hypothetical protein
VLVPVAVVVEPVVAALPPVPLVLPPIPPLPPPLDDVLVVSPVVLLVPDPQPVPEVADDHARSTSVLQRDTVKAHQNPPEPPRILHCTIADLPGAGIS